MKSKLWPVIFIGLLFTLTRAYIWMAKPTDFTEIIDVYMPYAHLWASGTKPYLQQYYEYPPATIPLFYLPHLIDMATLPYPWHINYGVAYRGILLITDISIFWLIIKTLTKFKVKRSVFLGSLIYYCLATAKAHNFIYDSMDLVFVAAIAWGVMAPLLLTNVRGPWLEWLAYWLGVALKLINGPLGLVYAAFEKQNLKRLILTVAVSGFIIWSIPLVTFRSSLAVMLVYHSLRGLQVESVPAQIAASINRFTNTETYNNLNRSINIAGPVSTQVKQVFDILFLMSLLTYTGWATRMAWLTPKAKQAPVRLSLTTGYLFCFMLFGKVLSTPYLLWQIPLLSLYPFKSLRQQLLFTVPSLIMVVISMTGVTNYPIGMFNLHLFIGWARSLLIAYLLWQSVRLVRAEITPKTV